MVRDNVVCAICSYEALDLRYHIERCHNLTSEKYKAIYGKPIISDIVKDRRRETSIERYGEVHFTNRPAASLSFQGYEGGHPLKDPEIRKKAQDTKKKLYGDPNYTNREKAKKTSLKRYGTEHTCAAPEIIKKRIKTLKDRYGKVFNVTTPHNKIKVPDDFSKKYLNGISICDLSLIYGVSEPVISQWVKDGNLKRNFIRRTDRTIESPLEIVSSYLNECKKQNKVLSFYKYGRIRGNSYCQKMKRLFNTSKKYATLKDELFKVALNKNKHAEFLENF